MLHLQPVRFSDGHEPHHAYLQLSKVPQCNELLAHPNAKLQS